MFALRATWQPPPPGPDPPADLRVLLWNARRPSDPVTIREHAVATDPDLIAAPLDWESVLSADEKATIAALCDVIIPADDRSPSASQVGADLFVDEAVIVELKVTKEYNPSDEAQLLNELKATGIKVGLLINFGKDKVEFKRMVF